MAAEVIDADAVNFMATHGRGLTSVATTAERLQALGIHAIGEGSEAGSNRFHVAVDLREGTTTGISAADRAATIRALGAADSEPDDFQGPGHVLPVASNPNGVLSCPGRAEAAVDLVRAAGFQPAAAICEILDADGDLARPPVLLDLAERFKLVTVTVD